MHATRFAVERFRLFERLELAPLAPFTLLVGGNGVGKTTVLEAFVAALSRDPVVGPSTLDRARELIAPRKASTAETYRTLFFHLDPEQDIHLQLEGPQLARRVTIRTELAKEVSGDVGSASSGGSAEALEEEGERDVHWRVESRNGTGWRVAYEAKAWRDAEEGRIVRRWEGSDQPLTRVYLSTSMWLGSDFLDTFSAIRRMGGLAPIIELLRAMVPDVEDLQIFTSGGEPRLEAKVAGVAMPVQLLGDGAVRALTYLLAATRAAGGFLLVDEIERGIHHRALVDVLRALGRRASEASTQIVATTHSGECVRAAVEALGTDSGQVRLIRLERGASGEVIAVNPEPAEVAAALRYDMEVR